MGNWESKLLGSGLGRAALAETEPTTKLLAANGTKHTEGLVHHIYHYWYVDLTEETNVSVNIIRNITNMLSDIIHKLLSYTRYRTIHDS